MPKHKKKLKTSKTSTSTSNRNNNQSGDDNSELNVDENASTISNASTNMSYQDLDSNEDLNGKQKLGGDDLIEKIDNIESQINTCLDGLLEKGFKEREDALKLLKKLFSNKYINEHLNDKRFTLTESLIKCLKKGKTVEQVLAAEVMALTFIQIGISSESSSFLNECKTILLEVIEDEKVEPEARAACVKALGLGAFIINDNSTDVLLNILDKFESLFSQSYAKGDGTLRTFAPKVYDLHSTALSMWALLLCVMPLPFVNKASQKHVVHFQDFLKSSDVDLRIVTGETIALLFDLAQCDQHSDLSCFEDENLIEILKNLANDSSKHRSKKDKKQQRSSFRDVLKTIEELEFESQTIKFGRESLYLDNWLRRKQYETFRDILGTGMNAHLQENEFIREVFDMGAPLINNDSSRKANLSSMNRLQKAQFNKEQFRSRTKSMNKKRDNKGVVNTSAAGVDNDDDDANGLDQVGNEDN